MIKTREGLLLCLINLSTRQRAHCWLVAKLSWKMKGFYRRDDPLELKHCWGEVSILLPFRRTLFSSEFYKLNSSEKIDCLRSHWSFEEGNRESWYGACFQFSRFRKFLTFQSKGKKWSQEALKLLFKISFLWILSHMGNNWGYQPASRLICYL